MAKQFDCKSCDCGISSLNNGDRSGVCPMGKLCVRPLPVTADDWQCDAKCPPRSRAIYKDKMGTMHYPDTITCDNDDNWISEEVEMTGKPTCEYEANEGFSATPPPDALQCTPLAPLNCASCVASQLIYISNGEKGAYVMCKKGALVTEPSVAQYTAQCMGDWNGVTKASCAMDDSPVQKCLDELSATTRAKVTFACDYGMCFLSCMNNAVFRYEIFTGTANEVKMNQHLKCYENNLYSADGKSVQNTMQVECV